MTKNQFCCRNRTFDAGKRDHYTYRAGLSALVCQWLAIKSVFNACSNSVPVITQMWLSRKTQLIFVPLPIPKGSESYPEFLWANPVIEYLSKKRHLIWHCSGDAKYTRKKGNNAKLCCGAHIFIAVKCAGLTKAQRQPSVL